jgi:peptidoglycan/xylan/chitin deacetylase (PgdA/CDA1 family)
MSTIVLMYHDVIEEGQSPDSSGFRGSAAAVYKLAKSNFEQHLDAIVRTAADRDIGLDANPMQPDQGSGLILTFDDGGISAVSPVASLLHKHRIQGYFFIVTDHLDHPGFLRRSDITRLHNEGHIIGTHSCSHSVPMARLGFTAMVEEWQKSRELLSELIGQEVTLGSVPGGIFARTVAESAAAAGLKVLFTSEPTTRVNQINGCLILGRYHLRHSSTPAFAAQLARGGAFACGRQSLAWQLKKSLRAIMYAICQRQLN